MRIEGETSSYYVSSFPTWDVTFRLMNSKLVQRRYPLEPFIGLQYPVSFSNRDLEKYRLSY